MFHFLKHDDFVRRIQQAHSKLPPNAEAEGKTECCRSGRCCWSGPCRLAPGDEVALAAHLGMTVQELFQKHLVVDSTEGGFVVMPRRAEWEGGHYLTDDETYDANTPCVFLTPDGCQVHDAKPTGGRYYKCWDNSTHKTTPPGCTWTREQVEALGWDGETW